MCNMSKIFYCCYSIYGLLFYCYSTPIGGDAATAFASRLYCSTVLDDLWHWGGMGRGQEGSSACLDTI